MEGDGRKNMKNNKRNFMFIYGKKGCGMSYLALDFSEQIINEVENKKLCQ